MRAMTYSMAAEERYALLLSLLRSEIPPPAKVVELGAAPGHQAIGLRRAGYAVTAVDIGVESDSWEGRPEGSMVSAFADEGIEFVVWNLELTPYPLDDAAYDAVVMTEVIEHLRDYPLRALQEVSRILKPSGRLYLTTPNGAYLGSRVRLALGRSPATPLVDWMYGIPFARHAREYTFAEMRELLEAAGLSVVALRGGHLHRRSGRTGPFARLGKDFLHALATVRPTLGPALIAIAVRSPYGGPSSAPTL